MFLRALKLLKLASTKLNYVKALLFTQNDSGIIKMPEFYVELMGQSMLLLKIEEIWRSSSSKAW